MCTTIAEISLNFTIFVFSSADLRLSANNFNANTCGVFDGIQFLNFHRHEANSIIVEADSGGFLGERFDEVNMLAFGHIGDVIRDRLVANDILVVIGERGKRIIDRHLNVEANGLWRGFFMCVNTDQHVHHKIVDENLM